MTDNNNEVADIVSTTKYFQKGEDLDEATARVAGHLADDQQHFRDLRDILYNKRFLPAGRVMVACGAVRRTTPYNCFVSGVIEDSMDSILLRYKEALQTMRLGGGIGYDFSRLRPSGFRIRSLDSHSCGPVGDDTNRHGFMDMFDSGCATIRSAGHRRGAQMGVLRVDHPDITHFIRAKREQGRLEMFNVSVGITDDFMIAVEEGGTFDLRFEGEVVDVVDAEALWNDIMRLTWDHAEPGVLFLDTINNKNNLFYCETIEATNPCGEQPLPPYGACLLGSFNLTEYVEIDYNGEILFNFEALKRDIPSVVRGMDNVADRAIFPIPEQQREAVQKRRMGLGVTGLANVGEILGLPYGSEGMLAFTSEILETIRDTAYISSIALAMEKGIFPAYRDKYLDSGFTQTIPEGIRQDISKYGIRNSHLLSIAPTGTISLYAGNVSSGIEPPFTTGVYTRNVYMPDGSRRKFKVQDYAEKHFNVKGVTSDHCSVDDHISLLNLASNLVDSSVSKTCNVGEAVTFDQFKDVYRRAYIGGASGCTTFRPSAIRGAVLERVVEEEVGAACYIDEQGNKSCD